MLRDDRSHKHDSSALQAKFAKKTDSQDSFLGVNILSSVARKLNFQIFRKLAEPVNSRLSLEVEFVSVFRNIEN